MEKIKILPVGRFDNIEVLALELACKVGVHHSSYLGLLLSATHKSMVVWDGWMTGFGRGYLCGKDNLFMKEGKVFSFEAFCLVGGFTSCLCCLSTFSTFWNKGDSLEESD